MTIITNNSKYNLRLNCYIYLSEGNDTLVINLYTIFSIVYSYWSKILMVLYNAVIDIKNKYWITVDLMIEITIFKRIIIYFLDPVVIYSMISPNIL